LLISFLGLPNSGKTTLALKLAASIKLNNLINCEIITEYARTFITQFKASNNLPHDSSISFTDIEQLQISNKQKELERAFKKASSPYTLLISDSSALNTLNYLSTSTYSSALPQFLSLVNSHYDVLVFCHLNSKPSKILDSNRIHSESQIKALEPRSLDILDKIKNKASNKVIELLGSVSLEENYKILSAEILKRHLEYINKIPSKPS
jgi:nicotinamide riboside kinase